MRGGGGGFDRRFKEKPKNVQLIIKKEEKQLEEKPIFTMETKFPIPTCKMTNFPSDGILNNN